MFFKTDPLNTNNYSVINPILQTNNNTGVIGIYAWGCSRAIYIESGSFQTIKMTSYHANMPGWHVSDILSEWNYFDYKPGDLNKVTLEIQKLRNDANVYKEIRVSKRKLDIFLAELVQLIKNQDGLDYNNDSKITQALEKIDECITLSCQWDCLLS